MLWYNNPDAISDIHDHLVRETVQAANRRRLLRLIPGRDSR
jgi:hypothetical protein